MKKWSGPVWSGLVWSSTTDLNTQKLLSYLSSSYLSSSYLSSSYLSSSYLSSSKSHCLQRRWQNCRILSLFQHSSLSRLKSKAVALLLGRGALKDLRDREGMAPIHLAVKAFDEEEARTLASVSSLIDFGADIDAVDKSGLTALHWAIYNRKTETAGFQILIYCHICHICVYSPPDG